jgi:c-di-GMP-binding flagellar brake protein YcgR
MQQPDGPAHQPAVPKPSPPRPGQPTTDADTPDGLIPREATRTPLDQDSPARMVLPNRQSVFVTLHDVSHSGCCVMRKGSLPVQHGDKVTIEFWRINIETKVSIKATVIWVRLFDGRTRAGLRFVDTSVKTQRAVQDYLKRSMVRII